MSDETFNRELEPGHFRSWPEKLGKVESHQLTTIHQQPKKNRCRNSAEMVQKVSAALAWSERCGWPGGSANLSVLGASCHRVPRGKRMPVLEQFVLPGFRLGGFGLRHFHCIRGLHWSGGAVLQAYNRRTNQSALKGEAGGERVFDDRSFRGFGVRSFNELMSLRIEGLRRRGDKGNQANPSGGIVAGELEFAELVAHARLA